MDEPGVARVGLIITKPSEQIVATPGPPPGEEAEMTVDVTAPGGVTLNSVASSHFPLPSPQMIGMYAFPGTG